MAIEIAAEEAGLDNYRIVKLPKVEDPFQKILNELTGNTQVKILKKNLGENYFYYKKLEELKSMKGIQALMPFEIIIR
ncbi:MAG: hypothetical protein IH594_09110 [Bacteroidales bacterium]|nr:hypothetical protein [Bacteroidales bacterium]